MFYAIIDISGRIIELHSVCNKAYADDRAAVLNLASDANSYRVALTDLSA